MILKRIVNIVYIVFLGIPCLGLAGTKCPAGISDTVTKTYQALGKDALCFKSAGLAENEGLQKTANLCITPPFQTLTSFKIAGTGMADSPAFKVGKATPHLSYSYKGTSSFAIGVYEQSTGKYVKSFSGTGPFSDEDTALNTLKNGGVYYLKINGSNIKTSDNTWSVSLYQ